jgi:hypothetical protein
LRGLYVKTTLLKDEVGDVDADVEDIRVAWARLSSNVAGDKTGWGVLKLVGHAAAAVRGTVSGLAGLQD